MNFLVSLDEKLFHLLNHTWCPEWMDTLMIAVTRLIEQKWIFAVFVLIWMIRGSKRDRVAALVLILLFILSDAIPSHLLKPLFARMRPPEEFWKYATPHISVYGFPSNHASNSFAAATFLSLVYPKKSVRITAFIVASVVCYSRVCIGVHYPLDVLGGAVLGASLAWVHYKIIGQFRNDFVVSKP